MTDRRVNRHRQPVTYPAPAVPSLRGQHKRIAEALELELGEISGDAYYEMDGPGRRAARMAALSGIMGRPVPAMAALSLPEATTVLIRLGISRGRHHGSDHA